MKKILILIIVLIACNKSEEEKEIKIASFGKEVVTKEKFEEFLKINLGEDPYRHTPQVLSELLDNYIIEKLLYHEALKENLKMDTQEETINSFIEKICSKLKEPPEETLREWYNSHREKFKTSNEYFFWEIFITDKEKAENVYSLLKKGSDFQKMVLEHSENFNKEKGGLLGPLSIEDIPEEIGLSLSKLKKGEISPLLPVSGGYMILKLKEVKPPKELSFEESKGIILDFLKNEMCQDEIEKIKKSLILKETIWVYQKNLLFSYCGQFPLYL